MSLLDGPPVIRRNFLDRICALLFPLYARRISDFRRAVRHRSILLREGKKTGHVSRAMAPLASWIWSSRGEAVELLSLGLAHFPALSPASLELFHVRGGSTGTENPLDDWWQSLEAWSDRERKCCLSLVGPHRDDLLVRTGGREAAVFFSRGQMRRASVAMMLAAGKAVEARLKRKPLILLDEIASELDREGRKITVDSLMDTGWQVIAAAAELPGAEWPGRIWKVEEGAVLTSS
jgi:DNA replication and repair protein RecF